MKSEIASVPPPRFKLLWAALSAVTIFLAVASIVFAMEALVDESSVGDLQTAFERTQGVGAQHVIVRTLGAGSPLRTVGIQVGDQLELAHPWDDLRTLQAGETFGFRRISPSPGSFAVVVPSATRLYRQRLFREAVLRAGHVLTLLTGMFILWRGRRVVAQWALAMAFVGFGSLAPQQWPASAAAFPFWAGAIWTVLTFVPVLFLRFAMDYDGRSTLQRSRWGPRLFHTLVIVQAVAFLMEAYTTLENVTFPMARHIRGFSYALQIFGLVFPCYLLARGWLRSGAAERKRYVLMLIALPLTFLPTVIILLLSLLVSFRIDPESAFARTASIGQVIGPLLFAYAILRHKILDLGFAINRALVFGAVSALVLVAAGLLEWASEHFIHVHGRDTNALLDAAFALTVFLTFHRVWSFVENRVETLLFHKWHTNEAALKRFIKEAAFISRSRALSAAFVSELTRFSSGAPCALYLVAEDGNYRLDGGALDSASATIDADDPALVTLRTNRETVELDETRSRLPAALALPMMHREALSGLILLGAKPSGESYRPDEIEILGWATHQIGLDLHALRVAQLEQELTELRRSNAALAAKNSDLLALKTSLGGAAGLVA